MSKKYVYDMIYQSKSVLQVSVDDTGPRHNSGLPVVPPEIPRFSEYQQTQDTRAFTLFFVLWAEIGP